MGGDREREREKARNEGKRFEFIYATVNAAVNALHTYKVLLCKRVLLCKNESHRGVDSTNNSGTGSTCFYATHSSKGHVWLSCVGLTCCAFLKSDFLIALCVDGDCRGGEYIYVQYISTVVYKIYSNEQ